MGQKQLLPLQHLERTSQSVANGNRLSGLRGGSMKAVPEIGEIAATGKIFDFDATFPIMLAQLWTLEKFLDKAWIQPLSKVMDERNEKVKSRVAQVKGNTDEVDALKAEAEKILADARAEAAQKKAAAKAQRAKTAETE